MIDIEGMSKEKAEEVLREKIEAELINFSNGWYREREEFVGIIRDILNKYRVGGKWK